MNPNSAKGISAAAGLGLLCALAVIAAPLAVGLNPWFVILPIAVIVMVVRVVDSLLRQDTADH